MIGKVRERPPRKKPSDVDFSSRRVMRKVRYAANKVKARNETPHRIKLGKNICYRYTKLSSLNNKIPRKF